jgi:hypothetical protein
MCYLFTAYGEHDREFSDVWVGSAMLCFLQVGKGDSICALMKLELVFFVLVQFGSRRNTNN